MGGSNLGTFLVVDDDESLRILMEIILESAGFETVCLSNAEDTISYLHQDSGSVQGVVLDLNLENTRGEDLYDEIVAINSDPAIFLMSGCHGDEIIDRLGGRPVDGIIIKPFNSADMIRTITEGVLRKKRANLSSERV